MGAKRTHQMSLYEIFSEHEIEQELKAVFAWVEKAIQRTEIKDTGRSGMSIEAMTGSE